jgi:hypothetical protein
MGFQSSSSVSSSGRNTKIIARKQKGITMNNSKGKHHRLSLETFGYTLISKKRKHLYQYVMECIKGLGNVTFVKSVIPPNF